MLSVPWHISTRIKRHKGDEKKTILRSFESTEDPNEVENKDKNKRHDFDSPPTPKLPSPKPKRQRSREPAHRRSDKTGSIFPTILPGLRRTLTVRKKLCYYCRKIDLDMLLSRPPQFHRRLWVPEKELKPVSEWLIKSCALCNLLYSTLNHRARQSTEFVPLRILSSNKLESVWRSISTNLLKVGDSDRCIVSQPGGVNGPVNIVREKIGNLESAKAWIRFCQSHHTTICSIRDRSSISHLKLIDCDTKTIVAGEGHPYVALSYVWGCSSEVSEHSSRLPATMPNTIKDSMTVTKRLGYRYIWIDRYCINQNNWGEVYDQVGKMDLIYRNAEITIIAAMGEDPSYGLPGVGQRKRRPENLTACANIGGHFLVSTDSRPLPTLDGTKWETRAWTYQEALLSRRRLVFAEEQMYFECYGMYCCESLNIPLESLHRKDMQGFKSIFSSKDRVGIFPKGVGTKLMDIFRRIEEYSHRSLTDPSDILNGMLGIFHAFQRSRLRIQHCAGIPLLPSLPESAAVELIGGWTREISFLMGLAFHLAPRSERRHGFPSWSWTGWHAPVRWVGAYGRFRPPMKVDPKVHVKVKLVDGRILNLRALRRLLSKSPMHAQLSTTLYITAWTIEIKIIGRKNTDGVDEERAQLKIEGGGRLEWNFNPNSNIGRIPGELCKGIILGRDLGGPKSSTDTWILVCGKLGDEVERIGLGRVEQHDYRRNDKDGSWDGFNNRLEPQSFVRAPELVKSWEEVQLR